MFDSEAYAQLVRKSRSYRRFDEGETVDVATLRDLIDLTRMTPSASNAQPMVYIPVADPETKAKVFPCLGWAGALKDWDGPEPGERPAGYIVILSDMDIAGKVNWDHGIVAQTMMLGAVSRGFGGCMIATIDRDALRKALEIPERYRIHLVLALGKPVEEVAVEPVGEEGSMDYWRDEAGVHHVPKRDLDDIIFS